MHLTEIAKIIKTYLLTRFLSGKKSYLY